MGSRLPCCVYCENVLLWDRKVALCGRDTKERGRVGGRVISMDLLSELPSLSHYWATALALSARTGHRTMGIVILRTMSRTKTIRASVHYEQIIENGGSTGISCITALPSPQSLHQDSST